MNQIDELLSRGVANIIPGRKELADVLKSGKKLNVYLGIDPTSTKIHLGHAVALKKLQAFAEVGHNVTFLIGDFTALIGDTSDKDSERPALTSEEIGKNFQTYKKQAEKIVDFSKVKVRYNSEWLGKLDFKKVIELCMKFSANDLNSRELIKKRLSERNRVGLHEFLYPVMQGYDSYFMDTDLQIGGTDQTFNMQAGRTLQKLWRNKESYVLSTEFLLGTDGRKMSKTWGNAVWLDENPNDMFAKVMAIKDELIVAYLTLATNTPLAEIGCIKTKLSQGTNPMQIKKQLAHKIVSELHDTNVASQVQANFEKIVQKQGLPTDIPIFQHNGHQENIIDLLIKTGLAESKSEAKRLVEQKGVSIDNQIVNNPNQAIDLKNDSIIKVGKRNFIKIKTSAR